MTPMALLILLGLIPWVLHSVHDAVINTKGRLELRLVSARETLEELKLLLWTPPHPLFYTAFHAWTV